MINWIQDLWHRVLLKIFIWSGGRLFSYIVVYTPEESGEVVGMTFTESEDYADSLAELLNAEEPITLLDEVK